MIILDGGMSRELQRVGAPFRQPEWSALALIETPSLVEQVHREYAAAGADVITTNSYALVPFHIGEARFQAEGLALAARAGELARRAANDVNQAQPGRHVRVAGSLPPVFGSYRPDLFDAARAQDYLSVLVTGLSPFVDIWLGETLSAIDEAKAALEALPHDGRPVWMSFTLEDSEAARGQTPALRSGEAVADAATWAIAAGIETLLFNCSQPEVMEPAIRAAAAVFAAAKADITIGVYANAFESHDDEKANETLADIRQDLDGTRYGDWAAQWQAAGAAIIGGCCGIGVRHINALSQRFTAEAVG
ncbi:MAG TPA: homocysteine S-methyltransferase family protein [Acidocella sp.]|nr:homocysteine S-methyltransferase family protein [Acidocella sp.]